MAKPEKKIQPTEKANLHPRNKHNQRYHFATLTEANPALKPFVKPNKFGDLSIDFFDPIAVKELNRAILFNTYGLTFWDIPNNYLCPPIPGRADYLHYAADLLATFNNNKIPVGINITCLDIGTGANTIYPIIGNAEYKWQFIGSDIDPKAIQNAADILSQNQQFKGLATFRLQGNKQHIFKGLFEPNELIDLSICNPPFHASAAEAQEGSTRKLQNLKGKKVYKPVLNFAGQSNELWCKGGEAQFIKTMIAESKLFAKNCFLFTTLVSKSERLDSIYEQLTTVGAKDVFTVNMAQGNKISRFVAWTFLTKPEQENWVKTRWNK